MSCMRGGNNFSNTRVKFSVLLSRSASPLPPVLVLFETVFLCLGSQFISLHPGAQRVATLDVPLHPGAQQVATLVVVVI